MTHVKKFAWSGGLVALAAVVAFAMLATTANAAVLSITRSSAAVDPGQTNTITIVGNNSAETMTVTATTGTFTDADCTGAPCVLEALPPGNALGTNILRIAPASNTTIVTLEWTAPATVTTGGTVTVAATQGATAQSTSFTLRGPASAITLVALETLPTSGCAGDAAEVIGTAASANGLQVAQLCAIVRDGAGNTLPGATVIFSTTAGIIDPAGATAGTGGRATSTLTAGATTASGTTATVTATSGTSSATTTVDFGGDATGCMIEAPESVALGAELKATVSVTDTAGNAVPDNTQVSLTAIHSGSGANVGVVPSGTSTVEGGEREFSVLSAIQGPIALIASAQGADGTTVSCTDQVQVGAAGPGTPAPGVFTPAPNSSGVNLTVFAGGTVASAAAALPGATSMWVTVQGQFVGYIFGAPAFVNAAFNAQFAAGIPANTPMIVVRP